jgi:SAM-dependent methyltransferase
MRRRRGVIGARAAWISGSAAPLAAAINSQAGMAAVTPRADRVVGLLGLRPGTRYLDIGCGTAAYAHLLARRAGMQEPPVCLDLAAGPGPVDALAWPGRLPLADASFDVISCLYFIRRLDDDSVSEFAAELGRVLAPGGSTLVIEVAPVQAPWLDRFHARLLSAGCAGVDLRGWGRLAALFTERGFDDITLVNAGPFLLPPIPRVGALLRKA